MPIQDVKKTNAQHAIPQNFMDVEFKIIGSLTMRQFLYLLVFFGTSYVIYIVDNIDQSVSPFTVFFILILLFLGLGFAFMPLEERGLDEWIVNFFKSIYSPSQRVWRKEPEVPSAFLGANMAVLNQELITLAPTSSRRKLEEYLQGRDSVEVKEDALDIPEAYYTEKARAAFAGERAAQQLAPDPIASIPQASISSGPPQANLNTISTQPPVPPISDQTPQEENADKPAKDETSSIVGTDPAPEPTKKPRRRLVPQRRPSEIALSPLTPDRHSGRRFVDLTPGRGHIVLPIRGERTIMTSEELGSEGNIQEKTAQLNQLLSQIRGGSMSLPTRQTLVTAPVQEVKPPVFKEVIELKEEIREESPAPVESPREIPKPPVPAPSAIAPLVSAPAAEAEKEVFLKEVGTASALEVPGSDVPNTIYGVVKDKSGKSLSEVVMVIKDDVGSPVRAFKTNSIGQFGISTPLSNGKYTVEIDSTKKTGLSFDIISVPLVGGILPPMEIVGK